MSPTNEESTLGGLPKICKNNFLRVVCASMPSTGQFGYRMRNLSGIKLVKRGPQNHFLTAVAKPAA